MAPPRSRRLQVSSSPSSSSDDDVQLLDPLPPPHFIPPDSVSSAPVFLDSPPRLHSQHPALESLLRNRGVRPSPPWLSACVDNLLTSRPGFLQLPISQQAECCLAAFLYSDLNSMGAPLLPPDVHGLHATELAGPFVLQVDEVIDIGSALRDRYKERPANPKRCLKLSMTDGIQRVYGVEYRPIKDLKVLLPAGFKIAIHHVTVRRGLLMLVPEGLIVLGGHVEHLEAAQQRVYQLINKPPRGEKNIRGVAIQGLSASATAAAWPTNQPDDALRLNESVTHQTSCEPIPVNEDQIERTEPVYQQRPSNSEHNSAFTYLAVLEKQWASKEPNAVNTIGNHADTES